MNLTYVEQGGLAFVEGQPNTPFLARTQDVDRLIEICFAEGVQVALLYVANVTPAFFDLSSGEAGSILQKLRNYHIRLAVAPDSGQVRLSSRFKEMVDEELRGSWFGVFETRQAALDWLRRAD